MEIVLCCPGAAPEPWLKGLAAALPQARVSEWRPGLPVADYAVVWAPPQAMLDEQAGVKALFAMGAGVDALLQRQLPPQTLLVRLDDAGMAVQMAEYVCHAVARYSRGFAAYEADATRAVWQQRLPRLRADCPIGIMGLGVLGRRVAQALRDLGYPVHGWSRTPQVLDGVVSHHGPQGLPGFLASCQVLVNLLPLTPLTRDILNRDTLGRLRPGAYLVNVARGAHLVEEDLLALLDSGQLSGATLDVFRTEPLPADHPFWQHPRLTLTPHISALTQREESIAQIACKIDALERGETVAGVVDVARGY